MNIHKLLKDIIDEHPIGYKIDEYVVSFNPAAESTEFEFTADPAKLFHRYRNPKDVVIYTSRNSGEIFQDTVTQTLKLCSGIRLDTYDTVLKCRTGGCHSYTIIYDKLGVVKYCSYKDLKYDTSADSFDVSIGILNYNLQIFDESAPKINVQEILDKSVEVINAMTNEQVRATLKKCGANV